MVRAVPRSSRYSSANARVFASVCSRKREGLQRGKQSLDQKRNSKIEREKERNHKRELRSYTSQFTRCNEIMQPGPERKVVGALAAANRRKSRRLQTRKARDSRPNKGSRMQGLLGCLMRCTAPHLLHLQHRPAHKLSLSLSMSSVSTHHHPHRTTIKTSDGPKRCAAETGNGLGQT